MTKNRDFVELLHRLGPPLKVHWVICGNTSNARLRALLTQKLPAALALLDGGAPLAEMADGP